MRNLIYVLFIFLFVIFSNCSDDNVPQSNCEVVINEQGPGFLKVVNELNSKIEVFLPKYAFAAIVRGNTCEIYGLNIGSRKAKISICADNDCETYSDTKKVTFKIEDDKTYIINVTADFFNN